MNLKVANDKDGNPKALLINLFQACDCQMHDSRIATLHAHDSLMSSLHVTHSYVSKKNQISAMKYFFCSWCHDNVCVSFYSDVDGMIDLFKSTASNSEQKAYWMQYPN